MQNTGGKTAALKALGLAALMAKAGLFLPASADEGALAACIGTHRQTLGVSETPLCQLGDRLAFKVLISFRFVYETACLAMSSPGP